MFSVTVFLGDRVLNEPRSFCEVRKVLVVSHERFLSWLFLLCSSHWFQVERGSAGKKKKRRLCSIQDITIVKSKCDVKVVKLVANVARQL